MGNGVKIILGFIVFLVLAQLIVWLGTKINQYYFGVPVPASPSGSSYTGPSTQYDLTVNDNGRTFTYPVTSRSVLH